jgi:hypothetical protein
MVTVKNWTHVDARNPETNSKSVVDVENDDQNPASGNNDAEDAA